MQAKPQIPSSETLAEFARSESVRARDGKWSFELSKDAWDHLQLHDSKGRLHRDVSVVPLFPVETPGAWVSILNSDGEELLCLSDMSQLSPINRELIEKELEYREFVPQIERVLWVSGTQEPCEWEVETNYGKTRFVLNSEEDVRRIGSWTVHFMDANGSRFRVDDVRRLDSRSRSYVEWYL